MSQRRAGLALLLMGILANPVLLGALLPPDGSIDGEARVRLIYLFDVFFALSGIALLWHGPRRWLREFIPNPFAATALIAVVSAAIVGTWWGIAAYRGAHHHTMDMSQMEPPSSEQRQWADDFVARSWESARRHGWLDFEK